MDIDVYSIKGMKKGKTSLPSIFDTDYRPDVIERAVLSLRSSRYQPKGTFPMAGLQTTAEYVGRRRKYRAMINKGMSHLPRVKRPKGGIGEVRIVPHAKGGRRAHPPKVEKTLKEKINKKEKKLAIRSAIAATIVPKLVEERGHKIDGVKSIPLIVEDSFETLKKTKEVLETFKSLGLGVDVERAKERKRVRAGRGKTRGRKYKRAKSPLIVVSKDDGVVKAARNIEGVDVVVADNLNVELLAPGGKAGRLTIWTLGSLEKVNKHYGS
jgi:large subunit ribosomal protein L4e